jgi:hypothetical protein
MACLGAPRVPWHGSRDSPAQRRRSHAAWVAGPGIGGAAASERRVGELRQACAAGRSRSSRATRAGARSTPPSRPGTLRRRGSDGRGEGSAAGVKGPAGPGPRGLPARFDQRAHPGHDPEEELCAAGDPGSSACRATTRIRRRRGWSGEGSSSATRSIRGGRPPPWPRHSSGGGRHVPCGRGGCRTAHDAAARAPRGRSGRPHRSWGGSRCRGANAARKRRRTTR